MLCNWIVGCVIDQSVISLQSDQLCVLSPPVQTASTLPPVTASCCESGRTRRHGNRGVSHPVRKQRIKRRWRRWWWWSIRRKASQNRENGRGNVYDIVHPPLFNLSLSFTSLSVAPEMCFCLWFSSHLKKKNSFCGYSILTVFAILENPKMIIVLCVGGRWAECSSIVALAKQVEFVRMWFLRSVFDRWYSWLPWLTLENELLLIRWNLIIYI